MKWLRVAAALSLGTLNCSSKGCAPAPNETPTPVASVTAAPEENESLLRKRLSEALLAKGPSYVPRTRHKGADGSPTYTNRLLLESSPYLLQHAHNPVNWFPWGNEAFEHARKLGRPIFLSVGYSTCHWCHVMEEESFEDVEIARYLNDHYVCIKVDREERPDIDAVYMAFVQSLTGRGGWPMSVWLTPSREPFFGGTYFPPRAGTRGRGPGFIEQLQAQAERFAKDPSIATEAQSLTQKLQSAGAPEPAGDYPSVSILENARSAAAQRFDPAMGGTRGAPKFPSSFPVRLLLRIARRANDADARRMATETLDHMRAGGIYDHVGGGFHRYATDGRWLVPHFEKMLYDNALLAVSYLEAAQLTGEPRYEQTVRETLDYLLREMVAPDGTFFSATDADSPDANGRREEGLFFTWTPAELRAALGPDESRIAQTWWGVTDAGHVDGRSVLHNDRPLADMAAEWGISVPSASERITSIRSTLLARRATRLPPLRDDKVIVAWNGLAVSAFARAAIVLGDTRYADAAIRAAQVLVAPLRQSQALPHVFVSSKPHGRGFSDDHVLLAAALIDLFELTGKMQWLDDAINIMDTVERDFADSVHGGYYLTAKHHEELLLRDKPDYDGPVPSVNSAAALVWLRLYTLTDEARFREGSETTMRAFSRTLSSHPLGLEQMLLGLDWATDAAKEIVIIVPEGQGAMAARPLLEVLRRRFVPNAVLVVGTEADVDGELSRRLPWVRAKKLRSGRVTAYVCERGACQFPTTDPSVFTKQLAEVRPYR